MSAVMSGGMIFLGFCFVLGAFILVSVRIYMISSEFVMKVLKYILIAVIWLLFSIASIAVGFRIDSRHSESYSRSLKSVSEIWGGEINQLPPSLTYPTKITEEFQNEKTGETKERQRTINQSLGFHSQNLNLKIHKTIRQKGLLIFPGYELEFAGTFLIKNTNPYTNTLYFHLNLPQFAGNISDIKVELDKKPYDLDTNLADGVDWSGALTSGEEHEIKIFYKARGTGSFNYSLANEKLEIKELVVNLETDFTDYTIPDLAMVPTSANEDAKEVKLNWTSKNLITGQNISLHFDIPGNYGKVASKLFFYSPLALFLFLTMILLFSVAKQISLHPMHYLFMIASFCIFYLLGSYLISYMSIIIGILISLIASTGIMVYYAKLINKGQFVVGLVSVSALIFQWFFSAAFFFPEHTGLLITIASILAFVGLLKATADVNWENKF
ncbi:MAG: inner membrane CreD family protein [Leptospiraceae bacterium]|nr:inner membrane CreD family protein [Leptospiraceae bacterium]